MKYERNGYYHYIMGTEIDFRGDEDFRSESVYSDDPVERFNQAVLEPPGIDQQTSAPQ